MIEFSEFVERKSQQELVRQVADRLVELDIDPEDFVEKYAEGMLGNVMNQVGQGIANSRVGQWAQNQYKQWNDPSKNVDVAIQALNKLGAASGKKFIQGGTVNTHLQNILTQLTALKNGLTPQQMQQGQFNFMNPSGSAPRPAPAAPLTNNPNSAQGSFAFS